jgi:hypothetical protein
LAFEILIQTSKIKSNPVQSLWARKKALYLDVCGLFGIKIANLYSRLERQTLLFIKGDCKMKKINLGVCFGIIMVSLCLFFETGYAATYYVKNSGNDNASGLDDNTAWRTIGKVNGFDFSDGDIVLFNRGDTFSDKTLQLKNVENFTIADYGEGEKPLFDGNKVQPLIISDSKNVIVKNIDISGQEWQIDISSNIYVENVEGLIIDGVYGNGHTTKGKGKSEGKTAITINAGSGEIEIKNCEIFNWGPYDLPKIDTEDFMGIALMNMDIGEYKIHDNKIYNINADVIHVSLTKVQGAIYDNILYNAGADAIDISGSENSEIYDNEFYRTAEFLGVGGKGSGGLPTYINLHEDENLHEGKERVSKNITINSNNFKDGDCVAIKLSNAENTNIYENNFSNVKSALYIQDLVTNTVFHHNIIENPQSRPTEKGFDSGGIYENNNASGTQIFNNTIYNEKGDCKHLIALECSNKTSIYNNITYQNNSSEDAFGLYHNPCGTEPVISNNYWYNPGKINRTKHSGKIYTANMQEEWNEKHSSGDKFDAPLMNDPEVGDYSLYEKNLKLGAVYSGAEEEALKAATLNLADTAALYVDKNHSSANDENPGTESEPFKTVQKGIESANAGETVYIKSGTYDLANFKKNIDKPLILIGEDKNSVILKNSSETMTVSNSLTLEQITFKDSGKAIFKLFATEGQTIDGVNINNCIFQNTPFVIGVSEGTTGAITNVNISDNEFLDINNSKVRVIDFKYGLISNVNIMRNTFNDLISTEGYCYGIFVGSNETRNTTKDIIIDGNYMDTIEGPTTVVDGQGKEVHGILAYGTNIRISNNTVKNLNAGTDHEAIYMKGSHSEIINNIVENCGSGDGGGDITIKGDEQLDNIISGNIVSSNKPGRGMLITSGDSIIENNHIEKTNRDSGMAGLHVYALQKSVVIKANKIVTKANSISLYDAVTGDISDNDLITYEGKTININNSENIEYSNNKECKGFDCQ